jgi:hypothetical protein
MTNRNALKQAIVAVAGARDLQKLNELLYDGALILNTWVVGDRLYFQLDVAKALAEKGEVE